MGCWRTLLTVTAGGLAVAASAACSGGGSPTAVVQATCPAGRSPDQAVSVAAGQQFMIALQANRTTPFHWVLVATPDAAVVQPLGTTYRADKHPPDFTGSGGVECWAFRAVAAGQTRLGFADAPLPGVTPSSTGTPTSVEITVH